MSTGAADGGGGDGTGGGEASGDRAGAELLDFSDSLGRFVVLNPNGQLFALNKVSLSRDYGKVVPRLCNLNFQAASSMAAGLRPSNITLVLHPGEHAHAYFLTRIGAGQVQKRVRVFQSPEEIIEGAVEDRQFPLISLHELQKAMMLARRSVKKPGAAGSPLPLPVRFLEVRSSIPRDWLESIGDLFILNAQVVGDKTEVLSNKLLELESRIKRTMVKEFFAKCVWLDADGTRLGRMGGSQEGNKFSAFVTGDESVRSFSKALVQTAEGVFEGTSEVANVIPKLVPKLPWSAPTIHIYDEAFRERNRLNEYYSLYRGLQALSEIGAPVLVHKAFSLDTAIPVSLLRPSPQIGAMMQMSARSFPIQDLCWDSAL